MLSDGVYLHKSYPVSKNKSQLQVRNPILWTCSNFTCFYNIPYFAQSDLLRETFFQILPQANTSASTWNLWIKFIIHTASENYFLKKSISLTKNFNMIN